MKKTKLTRSLLAACSIVALSAVMYGCVHSGDDAARTGGDAGMEMPGGTALAHAGLAAGMVVEPGTYHVTGASDALLEALDGFEGPTDGYTDGDMVSIGGLDLQCHGDSCGITVNDDGSFTTTGTITVVMTGGTQPTVPPTAEEMDAAVEAATAEAATKAKAIVTEGEQAADADAGLGGTGAPAAGAEGSYRYSVERDSDGTTVAVRVQESSSPDDDEDETFMLVDMDLGAGNTMHTRTMDPTDDGDVVTEVAFVSTDIAAPKATAFEMVEGQALNGRDLDADVDADGDGTDGNDWTALTVVAGTDDVNLPLIMSASFAPPPALSLSSSVQHTYLPAADDGDPDTDGDQPRAAAMVAGTYNRAMGTYECSGTDNCTVTVNDKGEVTAVSTGWTFIPAEDATSDVPDSDFLSWGFWLQKTTDSDGVTEYNEVETFAMAEGMDDTTGIVTGSASFSGGATGVYVHNVLSSGGGTVESRTAGHFTADASLMAYFGQPDEPDNNIPPNKLNSVTGSINNFMLSGDEAQDWSVALKGTINTTDYDIEMGTANGGGQEGDFEGQFYGAPDMVPGAVTGEFNANFSNGSVAGGFGARKQ